MWKIEKIPKTASFYWGNDTLSFLRYMTVFTFKKFNPDWNIRLYRPETMYRGNKTWRSYVRYEHFAGENYINKLLEMDIDIIELNFEELGFNSNVPETYKSDFLRWNILCTTGGLWSDFDIIYFKPMDCLYFNSEENKRMDTVVCLYGSHRIGFLLSSLQNDYYKYVSEQVPHCFNRADYQSIGSSILNRHFPTIDAIQNTFPHLNIHNIKMDAVYPLLGHKTPVIFNSNDISLIKEESIGIHWYGGHPEAGKWENILKLNNYMEYDNIICRLVKQVMSE